MAPEMNDDRLVVVLRALASLLREVEKPRIAYSMEAFAVEAKESRAGGDNERQEVVRAILGLYRGGMGSFQDLVLQDKRGVLPQQDRFDQLRSELFREAWRELR